MKRLPKLLLFCLSLLVALALPAWVQANVRVKDLGRIQGMRDNMLVGYGIVTGLAGTGDSTRSRATLQSVSNMLSQLNVRVDPDQLISRNVAAVTITSSLPAFARPGDKLDVNISSLGDARSLVGGTLMMAPLYGPDKKLYALAQGPITVGGFKFDLNGNQVQKNHPTTGTIPEGAIVEGTLSAEIMGADGNIEILLTDHDFTTATRIAAAINLNIPNSNAKAISAQRVRVGVPEKDRENLVSFVASIESIGVSPDVRSRVIVNERTGTVVSGGDVKLSKVTIAHGNLKVSITTDFLVSQPSLLVDPGSGVRTAVVPRTRIDASEDRLNSVSLPEGATVSDLVAALNRIKTGTRDVIAILQGIKRAGALHAELVVQ